LQSFHALLLAHVHDAVFATDHLYRFTFFNPAAEKLFGWTQSEVLGRPAAEVLKSEVIGGSREQAIQTLLETGLFEGEILYRRKDGSTFTGQVRSVLMRAPDGQMNGVVGTILDISARKQVEDEYRKTLESLREREERLRLAALGAQLGVFEWIIPTDQPVWENRRMYEIFGLSPDDDTINLAEFMQEVIHPDDAGSFTQSIAAALAAGGLFRPTCRIRRQNDGQWRWIEYAGEVFLDDEGRPLRMVGVLADITERKLAEQALKSSAERGAFRVRLAEAISSLSDPADVLFAATRVVGEHLGADRVVYMEIEDEAGVIEREYNPLGRRSLVGRHPNVFFSEEQVHRFEAGQTLAVSDIHQEPGHASHLAAFSALCIGAYLVVPLIKNGEWVAAMGVLNERPHTWLADEIALVRDTAERTWSAVMQARAEIDLLESRRGRAEENERFRSSIESLGEAFMILSPVRDGELTGRIVDFSCEYINQAGCTLFRRSAGEIQGYTVLEFFPEQLELGLFDKYLQVLETGRPLLERVQYSNEGNSGPLIQGVFDMRISKFGDGLIVTADDVSEQVRMQEEHQEAKIQMEIHHRLADQREKERQSYARDIHDGPIQTLSGLVFTLQYLKDAYPDPKLQVELSQIALSVKGAVQELRQLMNELRPPNVIRFGLAKAIQVHAESLRERYPQIDWILDLAEDEQLLPEQVCLAMFRIYQEAVNNILRHSQASRATVRCCVAAQNLILEISDNGRGFANDKDIIDLTGSQHFGLAGIVERTEAINGEVEIHSRPGEGTTVRVSVPLKPER
jgi:PAS domain S-box-containing protein